MLEWLRPLGGHGPSALDPAEWWGLAACCVALVMFAGLASGLTLGLMSLDAVDMEVLKRSGTEREKSYAARIIPVIANEHFLLVTLLLCNAAATEALPLFLDRLADPLTAVLLSTTVVLVFGEVIPQAVCSRYGLQIGANSAWFVRVLMFVAAPLAWPIGKLLDFLLGGEHTALFRRAQLKALVGLHAEGEGLGGTLSPDEIAVIGGALDLTHKTAWAAMTPLAKTFMLPAERPLDEACLQEILGRGHSRVPVYAGGDRSRTTGLLLAKELVLVDPSERPLVADLPMRPLPRLSAATPLYDMLKLFEGGGAHMALLTRPARGQAGGSGDAVAAATPHGGHGASALARPRSGVIVAGESAYVVEAAGCGAGDACVGAGAPEWAPPGGWGDALEGEAVGIITIEDVIEELLGAEIVDETDLFVDNAQTSRVDAGELSKQLPARLRKVLARGEFTPRVGRLGLSGGSALLGDGATAGSVVVAAAAAGPAPGSATGQQQLPPQQPQQQPPPHGHLPQHPGLPEQPQAQPQQAQQRQLQQQRQPQLGPAQQQRRQREQQQQQQQQPLLADLGPHQASPNRSPFKGGAEEARPADGPSQQQAGGSSGGGGAVGPPIERQPSNPVAIARSARSSLGGASGSTPGAGGSWTAGANMGARRVRFGTDSLHGSVVLKPRLLDPSEDQDQDPHA